MTSTKANETLVGLAMHLAELQQQFADVDGRYGMSRLKELEKKSIRQSINIVQENIHRLLDSTNPDSSGADSLHADVARFNEDIPFENSVFLMTKFPDRPGERLKDDILDKITQHIEDALRIYGLFLCRADKKNYATSKQLWDNVRTYMHGCKYGIAVLESKYRDEFNPNVALEYGFMLALGREVVLLTETTFNHRRADIGGTLGKEFRWTRDDNEMRITIHDAVDSWMIDIGRSRETAT